MRQLTTAFYVLTISMFCAPMALADACSSLGLDSNVSGKWCQPVMDILNDPNTCAGESFAKMKGKPIMKGGEICGSDIISIEQWQAIILSMIEVESSGNCGSAGDDDGKSQGLLQSTSGDSAPNPKSHSECTGDQKNCLTGLKCGMCLALSYVESSGVLFGGDQNGGGLAKMYGPWRSGNDAHEKQINLAKKACSNVQQVTSSIIEKWAPTVKFPVALSTRK